VADSLRSVRLPRRRSTVRVTRAVAAEFRPVKSLELESRVARLEILVVQLRDAQELTNKRLLALQARLDHVASRMGII